MKRIRLLSVFLAIVISGMVLPEAYAAETPSWSSVYESFVFDKTFLTYTDPAFYTEEPELIRFGLYDMDLDGIPELIAYDGCGYMAGATNYVFTCENGELSYLGDAGFRGSYLYYFRTGDYPGLFCTDGNMGYIETFYYDIQNGAVAAENVMEEDTNQVITIGKPQLTKVTERDDLFIQAITGTPVPLDMFTLDEIRSMGWQSFLSHSSSSADAAVQNTDPASAAPAAPPAGSAPSVSSGSSQNTQAAAPSAYASPFYGIWCSASKSQADMQTEAGKLAARGLPSQIFVTTDWDNLNPEFWYVLSAGTYTSDAAAYSALSQIQAVFPDAYVKYSGNYIGG